jgi:hypothetical protein
MRCFLACNALMRSSSPASRVSLSATSLTPPRTPTPKTADRASASPKAASAPPSSHYCNMIEAPWLVNGGHGASLRHHNPGWDRQAARAPYAPTLFPLGPKRFFVFVCVADEVAVRCVAPGQGEGSGQAPGQRQRSGQAPGQGQRARGEVELALLEVAGALVELDDIRVPPLPGAPCSPSIFLDKNRRGIGKSQPVWNRFQGGNGRAYAAERCFSCIFFTSLCHSATSASRCACTRHATPVLSGRFHIGCGRVDWDFAYMLRAERSGRTSTGAFAATSACSCSLRALTDCPGSVSPQRS